MVSLFKHYDWMVSAFSLLDWFTESDSHLRIKKMLFITMMPFLSIVFTSEMIYSSQACDHNLNSSSNSGCVPSRDSEGNVLVRCRIKSMTDLGQHILHPEIVYSLDISNNGLTIIDDAPFSKYNELVVLNLSYNNIQSIQRTVFNGLMNLKSLDLSFNSILNWNTLDIKKQLPSLTELNVTGNPAWLPGQHIIEHPNITLIKGIASFTIPYINHCAYCSLHKHYIRRQSRDILNVICSGCFKVIFYIPENFTFIWRSKFSVKCQQASDFHICKESLSIKRKYSLFSVELTDLCFQEIKKWGLPNIPIGLFAMFVNFVVMATVILTPTLKKKANMILIAKMAFGDFLQGLWLLILTVTRLRSTTVFDYSEVPKDYLCFTLFAIFITAQSLSVLIGFIVTIERYLCIVYSLKPNIRINRKIAIILMIFVWLYLLVTAILPFPLKMIFPIRDYSCLNLNRGDNNFYIESLAIVIITSYLISYILYARIFCTVRKSSLNMGMQREGKLAKRIIVVISTNLLFLFGPMIAGQILVISFKASWVTKMACWNAILFWFVGINSCLNPLLFAFRIEIFKTSLRRLLKYRKNEIGVTTSNN